MSRYRHGSIEAVWASYEWLIKEKLEALDHLTRQMYTEMQLSGASKEVIEQFVPAAFSSLWERVALEQERAKNINVR